MSQTFKVHTVLTDALPRICSASRCYADAIKGKNRCEKHLKIKRNPYVTFMGKRYRAGSRVSWIYFIKAGGLIKIGTAGDVDKRLVSIRTGCPVQIELLASIRKHVSD